MTTRKDGRSSDTLREVEIRLGTQRNPEGSVLYRCGGTTVLVAASVEEGVKDWLAGTGKGWVTAEYAMHPRANPERKTRDGRSGKVDGRGQEIQRLIGRALRSAVDLKKLGERSIVVDCDVLDADGGTRTASITGGWIALVLALDSLRRRGLIDARGILRPPIAAVSAGLWKGRPVLDLCYEEDAAAEVDLNVVGTATGQLVEVQGTAEGAPVAFEQFDAMVRLGLVGVRELVSLQEQTLKAHGVDLSTLLA